MKTSRLFFLATLTLGLLASCKSSTDSSPGENISTYISLASGNYWNFFQTDLDSNGATKSVDTLQFIVGDPMNVPPHAGNLWVRHSIGKYKDDSGDSLFVTLSDAKNILYYGRISQGTTKPILPTLKYPMAVGEEFKMWDTTFADHTRQYEVLTLVSSSESFAFNGTNYPMLHYTDNRITVDSLGTQRDTSRLDLFFAKGIGPVRLLDYSKTDGGRWYVFTKQELIEYKVLSVHVVK